MAIESLKERVRLPPPPEGINSAIRKYIQDLLVELVSTVHFDERVTINHMLDMFNTNAVYFDKPDLNGEYADGSWRLIKTDDGIELQKKISDAWVKNARWA